MQRIVIIGSGGAGKSTLARQLGDCLDLTVYHLDQIYWQRGWQPITHAEFTARQKAILKKPQWIMDGNYGGTVDLRLQHADTIIVLDLPTLTCLWRAFTRYWKYRNRTRPDMTPGNVEQLTWEYLRFILSYRHTRRPRILGKIAALPKDKQVFILKSRADVRALLKRCGDNR